MKRLAMVLIVLFTAASLFAGGKECDMKAHKAKSVALTGTLAAGEGTHGVFRTVSGQTYNVCEKTKSAVLKSAGNGKVQITGKVMSCGSGEELVIESAKKM